MSVVQALLGGLTLVANYIHSKLIERLTFLNDTTSSRRSVFPVRSSESLRAAFVYELPFDVASASACSRAGWTRWWRMGSQQHLHIPGRAPVTWSTVAPPARRLSAGQRNRQPGHEQHPLRQSFGEFKRVGASIRRSTLRCSRPPVRPVPIPHPHVPSTFSGIRLDGITNGVRRSRRSSPW